MTTNSTVTSRLKFINMVKQLTGIEYNIVAEEDVPEGIDILNKLSTEEVVLIEGSELNAYERCKKREQLTRARQQYNLEQIFSLALGHVSDDAYIDRLDLDWIMKFIELAKQSYAPTMHELWSKILAIELTQQGSFSQRSLKTLSELSSKEAKVFYKAVKAMIMLGEDRSGRIISGAYKKPTLINIFTTASKIGIKLSHYGLSFTQIITLAELGLLYQQEIETPLLGLNESFKVQHHRQSGQLIVLQKDVVLTYYKFTPVGFELSKLVRSVEDPDMLDNAFGEIASYVQLEMGIKARS
jgi:uncharacterized repeat protein (TIGR03899 family)